VGSLGLAGEVAKVELARFTSLGARGIWPGPTGRGLGFDRAQRQKFFSDLVQDVLQVLTQRGS